MLAKRHRQNHDFTILFNLVGSCHTADAAYALLCDLREERQMALDNYEVQKLRMETKEIDARSVLAQLRGSTPRELIVRKTCEADLLEIANNQKMGEVLAEAARDEIAFIDECIAEIQPLRKYAHLSDPEAVEAIQAEEWELELLCRVENFMATQGSIPADQFEAMRQHPRFVEKILPRINEVSLLLEKPDGAELLRAELGAKPKLVLDAPEKMLASLNSIFQPDKNGWEFGKPEQAQVFGAEFEELLRTEVEVPGSPIRLDDVQTGALTGEDSIRLAPFFVD